MEFFPPQIDNVIHQLESFSNWIDLHMHNKFRAIYQAMSCIVPDGDDKVRSLWLEIPRGSIDSFGEYEEFRDEGLVESPEDFVKYWMEEYPDDCKWYGFTTAQYKKERFFYIDSKLIFSFDEAKATEKSVKNEKYDYRHIYDFLDWLLFRVKEETVKLKQDVAGYNDYLDKNLSYNKRTGRLNRKKHWDILGSDAVRLDERLGTHRINSLRKLVEFQESSADPATMEEILAADFFRFCEVCYDANDYFNDAETDLSPIEKYRRMADRRDGGLCSIDLNSKSAFHNWYHKEDSIGAHPWEICRGGNSTHISLMVSDTNNGWILWLAGSSVVRVEETVRMAVALYKKKIPVNLYQGEAILSMVTGNDFIGIVPENVTPRYCHSLFPEEDKIIDFMNLWYENNDEVISHAYWYPLKRITI